MLPNYANLESSKEGELKSFIIAISVTYWTLNRNRARHSTMIHLLFARLTN